MCGPKMMVAPTLADARPCTIIGFHLLAHFAVTAVYRR